jgi:two-component system chemotaxis response regulator CheY
MKIASARILVVDDEPVMLKYVTDTLRRLGIQSIETCRDGEDALQTMASFKPDLVLTDIHMKPMGGLEFVRLLRSAPNSALGNTKVIFMSADASTETLGATLPLGAHGYIVKPPRLETLKAKLELALG